MTRVLPNAASPRAELKRIDEIVGIMLETVADQLRQRAGASLGVLAEDEELLSRAVETAATRPELNQLPPAPDHAEIRAIHRSSAPTPSPRPETPSRTSR